MIEAGASNGAHRVRTELDSPATGNRRMGLQQAELDQAIVSSPPLTSGLS